MFFNILKKPKKYIACAELQQEVENLPIKTSGEIPSWLSGTLIRNGPIKVTINGESKLHWFDGLAMLHAFSFHEGEINYSNKFLRSDAYRSVFSEGSFDYVGFAQDPCRSLFKRFFTLFKNDFIHPIQNANVNIAKLAEQYVALTEIPLPVRFDPKTLKTLGVFNYRDRLPKNRSWESAHPHHDCNTHASINYLMKFGRKGCYTIYKLEDGSTERKIIAEIPVPHPSYMHSFAVTENYIILTEYPLIVNPLDIIIKGKAFIENFFWKPEKGTQFIIIDRKNGKVIGKYKTKPFFAFHHVNAFETNGQIHIDIVTYENANILTGKNLYVNSDKSELESYPTKFERFSFSLADGKIFSEVLLSQSNEFPRINENFDGSPYCYAYLTEISDKIPKEKEFINAIGLLKLNTKTKEVLKWTEDGCSPGEPIFIPSPHARDEDEGVILAVISDQINQSSFLLILDGKSFKEIGRARAPHIIPAGFHGQYFNIQ